MLASVRVFSFKTGLLSKLAHDLELSVRRFELVLERGQVRGWFAADSFQVEGVVREHGLDTSALSTNEREQIAVTLRTQILNAAAFPRIEFAGRLAPGAALRVEGMLSLRGRTRPVDCDLTEKGRGHQLQATVTLTPSEFGIAPYKTLGGAIRLQDKVRVELTLQLAATDVPSIRENAEATYFRPDSEALRY